MRRVEAGWVYALVLGLYALLVVFSTAHHEPWRDEGQAWLIVRDLSLPAVFGQMGSEGTPAFWHLVLFPLAKLGVPYTSEFVVHVLFAIAAVAILLWHAPFPLWFKVLFVFSYYMSFEYAVIARNYNLTVLILFALAAIHQERIARALVYGLLVALLANTNTHSFAMAAGLGLLFVVDAWRRRQLRGGVLVAAVTMALGGCLALLNVHSSSHNQMFGDRLAMNLKAPLVAVKNAFLPGFPNQAAIIGAAAMALVAVVLWRRSRAALWLLVCGSSGLFAILVLKHFGGLRHHGLLLVFVIYALWIAWDQRRDGSARLTERMVLWTMGALFIVAVPYSFRAHRADAVGLYSGSRPMAAFMIHNGLQGRFLAAHKSAPTSAVLPFLPGKQAWYADVQALGSFVSWNKAYVANSEISSEEAAHRAMQAPEWGPGALLLLNRPLADPSAAGLILRHAVDAGIYTPNGEQMYLYEQGG